jgi:hypothetical protein
MRVIHVVFACPQSSLRLNHKAPAIVSLEPQEAVAPDFLRQ